MLKYILVRSLLVLLIKKTLRQHTLIVISSKYIIHTHRRIYKRSRGYDFLLCTMVKREVCWFLRGLNCVSVWRSNHISFWQNIFLLAVTTRWFSSRGFHHASKTWIGDIRGFHDPVSWGIKMTLNPYFVFFPECP